MVTAADTVQADLAIQGERIAAIGCDLAGARILDARDKLVIPGGVDPHVHLQMPTGVTVSSDDWMTGTMAAAFGGTTTVIDFVEPEPGETLIEAYEKRRAEAEGVGQHHTGAVIDYSLHMTLGRSALDHLDEVVAMIRASKTPAIAKERLVERFGLTAVQAQAILDMRLQRLTGLEREKILEEYREVIKAIARFREILSSERLVLNIIKEELTELKDQFGDFRRTEIAQETREITLEDMIVEEDMVVTISNAGYIKRNPITLYQRDIVSGGQGNPKQQDVAVALLKHLLHLPLDEHLARVLVAENALAQLLQHLYTHHLPGH